MSLEELKIKINLSEKYESIISGLESIYGSLDTLKSSINEIKEDVNYIEIASENEKSNLIALESKLENVYNVTNDIKNVCISFNRKKLIK